MRSGQMRVNFQPLPLSESRVPLGVLDQVRIRDRATILSRHLFSDQGEPYADKQVRPSSSASFLAEISVSLLR